MIAGVVTTRPLFPRHAESSVVVRVAPEVAFAFLDAHENIAAHMDRPSWAMLGGTMTSTIDKLAGKETGSVIQIEGKVLGFSISLVEKIVERVPPRHKRWEIIGTPRLIVMGRYRMGFDIERAGDGCRVTVVIDYDLPEGVWGSLSGQLFAPAYARWCVQRIVQTVAHEFSDANLSHAR